MRYLIFTIFLAALVAVIACARPVANASNDTTAQNTAPAAEPAGTNIQPIPTPPPNEEVPRITLADAKKAFDDGTGYFIDARPAEAYNDEHIKGAVNITYDKLDAHIKDLKTKEKIIVYCSWPNEHTSASLVAQMIDKGIKNAAALLGGTAAWKGAKYPMEGNAVKNDQK